MGKHKDISGKQFGELIALERVSPSSSGRTRWLCLCACGEKTKVRIDLITSGNTKSCGCRHRNSGYKHGYSKMKVYRVWADMVSRCTNNKDTNYERYGGRGITVSDTWINDSAAFCKWALANGYSDSLQIDRRDNNKGYSPSNCRFITKQINLCNTRRLSTSNTSGYRGVSFVKDRERYTAKYMFKGVTYHVGTFSTPVAAAIARDIHVLEKKIPLTLNFAYIKPTSNTGWAQ